MHGCNDKNAAISIFSVFSHYCCSRKSQTLKNENPDPSNWQNFSSLLYYDQTVNSRLAVSRNTKLQVFLVITECCSYQSIGYLKLAIGTVISTPQWFST